MLLQFSATIEQKTTLALLFYVSFELDWLKLRVPYFSENSLDLTTLHAGKLAVGAPCACPELFGHHDEGADDVNPCLLRTEKFLEALLCLQNFYDGFLMESL